MRIYLVGGAVRDKLLSLPVTDKDWVVVGATPQQLLEQGYQQVGNHFPVFLHPKTKEEYALARTESKSGKGYTGFTFDFNPHITIEDDLIRRDLTINAIAQTEEGNLIDPYHGLTDLKKKILRHISPAFSQDPLRVLRVARFYARFHSLGFRVATETAFLMKKMVSSGELNYLTKERVWQETEKALKTTAPELYFSSLNDCGALSLLFPEVAQLFQFSVPGTVKTKISYGQKMLLALKSCTLLTEDITCRFAMTCYLSDKAYVSSKQPHIEGMRAIRQLCTRLKVPIRFRDVSLFVYQYYDKVINLKAVTAKDILKLFDSIDAWRHPLHLRQLIICSEAHFKCSQTKQQSFTQGNYLIKLYQAAKAIDLKKIINDGYSGRSIKEELNVRRLLAIEKIRYVLSHH